VGTLARPASIHYAAGGRADAKGIWAVGTLAAFGLGVALRRPDAPRKRIRTQRHVSLAEIDQLSVDDCPVEWQPKISLGMAKRNYLVQAIRGQLDKTFFLMAWNKDGMPTSTLEAARAMFPPQVKVRCLKNTLVKVAMKGTPWDAAVSELKGPNMYVFCESDNDVRPTIEAYLKMEKKFNRAGKLVELKEQQDYAFDVRPLRGGIMRDEWNFIQPEEFPKLKNFPTKLELIAQIAGGIKQVPQKLAVGINQLPQKLAIGTKKIVEKMEEEGKSNVADVVV